tara:strand:+ start:1192 stop:2430 length:1239 start_codon:yes stop_codon:yes gene_type:complete
MGWLHSEVNPSGQRSIWIHAVSVGEVLSARALIVQLKQLYPEHRILVSTTTTTGQDIARRFMSGIDATFYVPLDLTSFVNRALDRAKPEMLILIDTEIWPNLLKACHHRGVKTILLNGRLSDASYRRYQFIGRSIKGVMANLDRVCAQTPLWGQRFINLGVLPEQVKVTGSLKYDSVSVMPDSTQVKDTNALLKVFNFAPDVPVIIAGSTTPGEEQLILNTFKRIRSSFAKCVLILAPRRPERFLEVRQIAINHGFSVAMRTDLRETTSNVEVIVLDTLGELNQLFKVATIVFVGGSLVDFGGHNILEPAIHGKPIIFGKHMENFLEISSLFVSQGAALQVHSSSELEESFRVLLNDPKRCKTIGTKARSLIAKHRGACSRSLKVIVDLVPPPNVKVDSRVQGVGINLSSEA